MCSFPVVCSPLCSCSESVFILSNRAGIQNGHSETSVVHPRKWQIAFQVHQVSSEVPVKDVKTGRVCRHLYSNWQALRVFVTRRTRWCLVCVGVFVWPYGLFLRFKEDPYVAAEGNTPEQGSRRGKYTHTHTPVLCSCRGYTAAGRTRTAADRWSSSIPCHSQHVVTHTHTHHRTQHHLSLLQLIKLIKLVM